MNITTEFIKEYCIKTMQIIFSKGNTKAESIWKFHIIKNNQQKQLYKKLQELEEQAKQNEEKLEDYGRLLMSILKKEFNYKTKAEREKEQAIIQSKQLEVTYKKALIEILSNNHENEAKRVWEQMTHSHQIDKLYNKINKVKAKAKQINKPLNEMGGYLMVILKKELNYKTYMQQ